MSIQETKENPQIYWMYTYTPYQCSDLTLFKYVPHNRYALYTHESNNHEYLASVSL